VMAIILSRSVAAIPSARQINVLANNAVSGATRGHRHVGPGGVPRVRDRVVLPGRGSFQKVLIKARDDVDLAVGRIIRRAGEIARTRHGSARAPGATSDVVVLVDARWSEGSSNAAETVKS